MTELYQCFLEKRYPEDWDTDWQEHTYESLGLFLVQYLCNGFNLAEQRGLSMMITISKAAESLSVSSERRQGTDRTRRL